MPVRVNPYLCRQMSQGSRNTNNSFVAMGGQSQVRNGSIKSCLKRGGMRFKYPKPGQRSIIPGERPFTSIIDCIVCKAQHYNKYAGAYAKIRVPKRAHHVKCFKNTKTKGLSERTVQVEVEAARNIATNNGPIANLGRPGTTAQEKWAALYPIRAAEPLQESNDIPSKTKNNQGNKDDTYVSYTPLATELRRVLDDNINLLTKDQELATPESSRAPNAVVCLIKYILESFQHNKTKGAERLPATVHFKQQFTNYRRFFRPGEVVFTFPLEEGNDLEVNPFYHSLEGTSIFVIDWMLSHEVLIECPNCHDSKLHHDRTSFSHNGTLFPVMMKSGSIMWGVVMWYQCPKCAARFAGNVGAILSSLAPRIHQAYPVEPRYASGGFHLHCDVTDDIDMIMKTYGNGDLVSRMLMNKQAKFYQKNC